MIHCLAEYIFLKTYCHGVCVPLWIHGRTVHCVVVPDLKVCLNAALLWNFFSLELALTISTHFMKKNNKYD